MRNTSLDKELKFRWCKSYQTKKPDPERIACAIAIGPMNCMPSSNEPSVMICLMLTTILLLNNIFSRPFDLFFQNFIFKKHDLRNET